VRKPGGRRLATLSRSRFSLAALILVLSVLAIAPMAGASTPDPLWIEGMYDGADRDDAVGRAISLAGVVELRLIVERFLSILPERPSAEPRDVVTACITARRGRSPPRSISLFS